MPSPRILLWYGALARAKAIASRRYRMLNPAEVGSSVSVLVRDRLPAHFLDAIDALVIIRPYPTRGLDHALEACRARGIPVFGDFDDLLFAGAPEERPEVRAGRLSVDWMRRAQAAYASVLPRLDGFFVSTAALADELRDAHPLARVFVIPNGLSPSWVAQGRRLYPSWQRGMPKVLRFFPGSPTHDEGFERIVPALAAVLEAHRDVSLELVGNLQWDPRAFPDGRVRARAAVPFDHLPALLASTFINLWPRTDGRFDRVKSAIKFLEAAAFGTPTVASTWCVDDDIACDGLLPASTEAEWIDALERLVDDDARAHASDACLAFTATHGGAGSSWDAMTRAASSVLDDRNPC